MTRVYRVALTVFGVCLLLAVIAGGSLALYRWADSGEETWTGTKAPASAAASSAPTVSMPSHVATPSASQTPPARSKQTTAPGVTRSGPKRFTLIGDGVPTVVRSASPIIGTRDTEYLWWSTAEMDMATATDLARTRRDALGQVVVLAMGSSAPITRAELDTFAEAIGPQRALVLVGPGGAGSAKAGLHATNTVLYQFAQQRPDTFFVDWQGDVDTNPDLVSDRIVPTTAGARTWMARVNWIINTAFAEK